MQRSENSASIIQQKDSNIDSQTLETKGLTAIPKWLAWTSGTERQSQGNRPGEEVGTTRCRAAGRSTDSVTLTNLLMDCRRESSSAGCVVRSRLPTTCRLESADSGGRRDPGWSSNAEAPGRTEVGQDGDTGAHRTGRVFLGHRGAQDRDPEADQVWRWRERQREFPGSGLAAAGHQRRSRGGQAPGGAPGLPWHEVGRRDTRVGTEFFKVLSGGCE